MPTGKDTFREYTIEISKLKDGANLFEYEVDKRLFEYYECEEIEEADVRVTLSAVKRERMIEMHFAFSGRIGLVCSRCLSRLWQNIDKEYDLIVRYGEEYEEVDVNEIIIPEKENKIDILNIVYEEIRVEVPISPVHGNEDDCDREMIDRLHSLNNENTSDSEEEIDPRWAKLKELKNK